jgi:hypothetical protein
MGSCCVVEDWVAGGVPTTMMMNMERRAGHRKPVIRKALVELASEPFRYFAARRSVWAVEDLYASPGPIQFSGPAASAPTHTLLLELGLPLPEPTAVPVPAGETGSSGFQLVPQTEEQVGLRVLPWLWVV